MTTQHPRPLSDLPLDHYISLCFRLKLADQIAKQKLRKIYNAKHFFTRLEDLATKAT